MSLSKLMHGSRHFRSSNKMRNEMMVYGLAAMFLRTCVRPDHDSIPGNIWPSFIWIAIRRQSSVDPEGTLKRLHGVNIHRGTSSAHHELPDGSNSREIANHLL